jgi:hypothetical protein
MEFANVYGQWRQATTVELHILARQANVPTNFHGITFDRNGFVRVRELLVGCFKAICIYYALLDMSRLCRALYISACRIHIFTSLRRWTVPVHILVVPLTD